MKKWFCILCAALLVAACATGCGEKPAESTPDSSVSSDVGSETTTANTTENTTASSTENTTEATTEAPTTEPPATTTAPPPKSSFKSDLKFPVTLGSWMETAKGFQVFADDAKTFWALSDTKMEAGQGFTYEMDVTVDDSSLKNSQIMVLFGSETSEHIKQGAYDLRLGFKDDLMRIFYTGTGITTRRYGKIINFTDDQKAKTSFHIKLVMTADNKASYYVDGKAIEENIEVTEYAGGYLGIATWGTSATFQNVTLKVG